MNECFTKHPKVTYNNTKAYCAEAMQYPPNFMEFKEKRWNAIKAACVSWGKSFDIHSALHQMKGSYLLGENEYVIKPFIAECAKLYFTIEEFENWTKKSSKGCPEVTDHYKQLLVSLDKKQIVSWMLEDIAFWESEYSFSCGMDKKEQADLFKKELENLRK